MATNVSGTGGARRSKPAAKRPRPKTTTGNGATGESAKTARPAAKTRSRRTAMSRTKMNFNNPMVVGAAAAAAGVVAGLAATVGRKAAVQAVSALSGDWLEALKAEHRYALGIFDKIEATTDDQTAKRMTLLTQLKHALGKHAFEEENVVYPALRDLGDKEAADKLNHEHGYVKQYLYDLENMPRDDVRWMAKLGDFRRDLQRHIREEEDRILPGMRSRLTAEQNAKLSAVVNKEGFKLA
jgi:hemerythrin superfamily protein